MIAEIGKPCGACGTLLVIGSSAAYCPACERAFHALKVRYDRTGLRYDRTGVVTTFDEIMLAMIADDAIDDPLDAAAAHAIAVG